MLPSMITASTAGRWRALALLSAIFGIGVSAYLLVEYTTGQPGICLTGSGCDEVRASDFAYPLGMPMPLSGWPTAPCEAVRSLASGHGRCCSWPAWRGSPCRPR
jgi:hypothetical protein